MRSISSAISRTVTPCRIHGTTLIAIDPGTKLCGWARFDEGAFSSCGLVRTKARVFMEQLKTLTMGLVMDPIFIDSAQTVVIERPEVYRSRFLKGDPNDLISVAIVVGAIARTASPFATIHMPLPKEWKGQVPKEVTERRLHKQLTKPEFVLMSGCLEGVPPSLRHNVTDAVSLGFWAMKGMKCS